MHKIAKGLKKKKKQSKKVEGEEFDAQELERFRREQAEAQQKLTATRENIGNQTTKINSTGNDEWKKFQALTSGIDSVLKKTQDDLDRIKSTSFFQRQVPKSELDPKKDPKEQDKRQKVTKRYIGFDKDGNPVEQKSNYDEEIKRKKSLILNKDGFIDFPDNDEEHDDSIEEDIFDTTYIDVLQNINVKLAYIPDSPTKEQFDYDPFDTTNADKVLKTIDKTGKKLVSLGNAVEVLSGRIDYISSCKVNTSSSRLKRQDLLGDFNSGILAISNKSDKIVSESIQIEKNLLDDDSDVPDIPIDLTIIPPVLPGSIKINIEGKYNENNVPDISEFELLKNRSVLDEIPILDEHEFDLDESTYTDILKNSKDPFAEKDSETDNFQEEIIDVSFEVATFIDEKDPFDTTIAENILPGKTELKFIEKELKELSISEVSTSLRNTNRIYYEYEINLLKEKKKNILSISKTDLLGGSNTELNKLIDKPIEPIEELSYGDPFNTSAITKLCPGKTELKVLEKEFLSDYKQYIDPLEDEDFDPRKEEALLSQEKKYAIHISNEDTSNINYDIEDKQPLTPHYLQKDLNVSSKFDKKLETIDLDPFDTSFVDNSIPSKTELKLIESELLQNKKGKGISYSLNIYEFNSKFKQIPSLDNQTIQAVTTRPTILKSSEIIESLIKGRKIFVEKQGSILDTDVNASDVPLLPNKTSTIIEEEIELSYKDPFDTSQAINLLPSKAELKLLENELSQIPDPVPIQTQSVIELANKKVAVEKNSDFFLNVKKIQEKDILCTDTQEVTSDKILTPIQDNDVYVEDTDPFDTSFANVNPGKTELKLLESELINR